MFAQYFFLYFVVREAYTFGADNESVTCTPRSACHYQGNVPSEITCVSPHVSLEGRQSSINQWNMEDDTLKLRIP